jgi:predicted DNA-binding transcriptional regulator AlpA
MDGMQSDYMTMKQVMAHFGKSRPTIDRWRQKRGFPASVDPNGTGFGPLMFPRREVYEWETTRPRRTLRPPADDSE